MQLPACSDNETSPVGSVIGSRIVKPGTEEVPRVLPTRCPTHSSKINKCINKCNFSTTEKRLLYLPSVGREGGVKGQLQPLSQLYTKKNKIKTFFIIEKIEG